MTPLFCTAYMPPLDYMAAMAQCRLALVECCETYPKQTLRNRTIIATAGGPMPLTVPVSRPKGSRTITADVEVCHHELWNVRHVRAIEAAYRAAPYFMYYWDDLRDTLLRKHRTLLELNDELLTLLLKALKIDCQTQHTSLFLPPAQNPCDQRRYNLRPTTAQSIAFPIYQQVFADRIGFLPNISVLDLLFCLGPNAKRYLQTLTNKASANEIENNATF